MLLLKACLHVPPRLADYYRSAIISAPFAATVLGLLVIVLFKLLEMRQKKRRRDGELTLCTAENAPANQNTYGAIE